MALSVIGIHKAEVVRYFIFHLLFIHQRLAAFLRNSSLLIYLTVADRCLEKIAKATCIDDESSSWVDEMPIFSFFS